MEKRLHIGHRGRLRNRLRKSLAEVESYEILEYLLTYIYARKDTKTQSKKMFEHYGNIGSMIQDDMAYAMQIEGIGEKGAEYCMFLATVAKQFVATMTPASPDDQKREDRAIPPLFARYIQEQIDASVDAMYVVCVNAEGAPYAVYSIEDLMEGKQNYMQLPIVLLKWMSEVKLEWKTIVLVRVTKATMHAACQQDIHFYLKISRSLALFKITLLDYVIYTKNSMFSTAACASPVCR